MDLLESLATRYSQGPRQLAAPGPTRAQLEHAVALAARAPDHLGLAPWRFVLVGAGQRARLGELFAAAATRRGAPAAEVERAPHHAAKAPVLLAVVAQVREDVAEVPPHEQWMSVGAAVMNLLDALHLMGFGAKLLSGDSVHDAAVQAAFCGPGERLVAWVVCGTPTTPGRARPDAPSKPRLSDWA
ncbi:nitroreductase family protein [Rubrivivax gelatinosus]|uniref:Putative NAD(P)H nitroreductase n=1 Tax=Rubrivivax gelatinosus (strain NBRC 100245 / IL144) TaxID=983917 RepID=I0HQT2_RUBGI|nr:nitroreductase [Rubrivivax gelatinosus]BAL95369.1 nitroreductase family protein [Rubrivivax gelatinosus IL144]